MTKVLVVDVGSEAGTLLVRVHQGVLRRGDRIRQIDFAGVTHQADLVCEQVWIYEGVLVDALESNFGGRARFSGPGVHLLARDAVLST